MTKNNLRFGACGILFTLSLPLSGLAFADGKDWNDGPVVNSAYIRTVDGHFNDYMHWLATTYRKRQEAAKAAGLVTNWRVLVVEARTPRTRTSFW